jgi:hypothetical protein
MTRKMSARRTSIAWQVALLVGAAAAGCGSTPNVLPNNDFARPTDIAFMCFGAFPQSGAGGEDGGATDTDGGAGGPVQITGQAMRQCHPPGPASQTVPNGQDPGPTLTSRTFAFVANSANGELTVVDADKWKLIDLDPESAGYDSAFLGALPEQISVTNDGCRLVSANRGSGDLTLVDPSVLLAPTFEREFPGSTFPPAPPPDTGLQRGIVPRGTDGTPVGAPPFEAVFLPVDVSGFTGGQKRCPPMDGSSPQSWPALVSFPTCDLVALVDLPSGVVIDSLFIHGNTFPPSTEPGGTSPHCSGGAAGSGVDGGTGDDGGASAVAVTTGTARPWSLQVTPDGTQGFVSLSNAPAVIYVPLSQSKIGEPKAVPLHDRAGGSDRIRLGVDPYHDPHPAFPGLFVGDASNPKEPKQGLHRRYLYVIAHDGTLAVINVENPDLDTQGRDPARMQECETNYDPLANLFQPQDLNCIPLFVPDPSDPTKLVPTPRRPGAVNGPGIHLPTGIPVDVAAADIRGTSASAATNITTNSQDNVSGAFAWVLSSSGQVYLVNIDPDPRKYTVIDSTTDSTGRRTPNTNYPEPTPYANSLRDANRVGFQAGSVASYGPPRLDDAPIVPTGEPFIETFYARYSVDNWTALDPTGLVATQVYFPTYSFSEQPAPQLVNDFNAVTPQTWLVSWQGTLVGSRFSGHIDYQKSTLQDGVGFCESNVLPGDLVTLNGCLVDSDCGSGTVCLRSNTAPEQAAGGLAVRGLCVDPNHKSERMTDCAPLLQTPRRYEITDATDSLLTLRPHRDELVRSALTPCRLPPSNSDGGAPDGGGPDGGTAADVSEDCRDPNDPTTGSYFICTEDPMSRGRTKRCLTRCAKDGDNTKGDDLKCRQGHICVNYGADPADGTNMWFCADGPRLESASFDRCFDQLVTYQVNVGNGYLVSGSSTGILPQVVNRQPTSVDPNQQSTCQIDTDPKRNPRQVSRIPVGTSSIPGGPDPTQMRCKSLLGGFVTDATDPSSDPTKAFTTLATADTNPDNDLNRLQVLQTTPAPTDPCFFIGGPSSDNPTGNHVRAIFQNTQLRFVMGDLERAPSTPVPIRFDVHGGFSPQAVIEPSTVQISMPARIVLTPVDSQPQGTPNGTPGSSVEAPYLMVVDQRRLGTGQGGGPTRGQLLRINPFGYAATYGYQPWFEDYQHSNSLFPIQ